MRTLLVLLFSTLLLPAQLNVSNSRFTAAVLKPAAAGGGCSTQQDAEESEDSFQASFLRYFATKFRAGANYNLCRVDLSIARNVSEDADFLVTIRTDSSGPTTTVVGTSSTVPNATVTEDFAWVRFDFPSPPSLTSGTDYWIVITRADAADGLQVYWNEDTTGTAVEGIQEAAAATPTTWNSISTTSVGMFRTFR